MSPTAASQKVAIVTGASGGIAAGMVDAFRAAGYAVVGTARSMPSSDDPDLLTVDGDLAHAQDGAARRGSRRVRSGSLLGRDL